MHLFKDVIILPTRVEGCLLFKCKYILTENNLQRLNKRNKYNNKFEKINWLLIEIKLIEINWNDLLFVFVEIYL